MSQTIEFFVPGIPQPGGSKRGFYNPKMKRVIITEDNARSKPWRAAVSEAAMQAVTAMLDGPLAVRLDFIVPRPKGHFGSGRNEGVLRASAPAFPAVKPDVTKLVRPTEDALKGILWRDDAQIVSQAATKRYGPQAGCRIRVRPESA